MTGEVKKKRNRYNEEILKRLNKKYGYGLRYITMCLGEDFDSEMAGILKKEYAVMLKAIQKLLNDM